MTRFPDFPFVKVTQKFYQVHCFYHNSEVTQKFSQIKDSISQLSRGTGYHMHALKYAALISLMAYYSY